MLFFLSYLFFFLSFFLVPNIYLFIHLFQSISTNASYSKLYHYKIFAFEFVCFFFVVVVVFFLLFFCCFFFFVGFFFVIILFYFYFKSNHLFIFYLFIFHFCFFSDYKPIHQAISLDNSIASHHWAQLLSVIGSNNDQIKSLLWSAIDCVIRGNNVIST